MKLNLGMVLQPINGYINVTPAPVIDENTISTVKIIRADIKNLDNICSDAEANEIIGTSVLNSIHVSELGTVLQNWVKKLRHGGVIKLGGLEIEELSRKFYQGELNEQEFNSLVFGNGNNFAQLQRGAYSIEFIAQLFTQLGLKIIKKSLINNNFVVEGKRE